jgi:hypothetical protein
VLWDREESSKEIFTTFSRGSTSINFFIVWRDIMEGQRVHLIDTISIYPSTDSQVPIMLLNGNIYSQTSEGRLRIRYNCYGERPEIEMSPNRLGETLAWLMGLRKYREAYKFCLDNDISKEAWIELGKSAAINMNLEYGEM